MAGQNDECLFRILGPVQVGPDARPVVFGRRQQLDLMALLLLRAGRVLAVDQIVDAMWGGDVPRTAAVQVKNMMSGLRTGLGPLATIEWQPAGYRLAIHQGRVDVAVFADLVAGARRVPPVEAVELLRAALELWRGRAALGGVRAHFAHDARAHLFERRTEALEDLFGAELAAGRHHLVVAELIEAVAEHPQRETLVAQLMTALHRDGRTSDALAAYHRARRVLVDECGLEPGPALRDLQRRILGSDPGLDPPGAAATAAVAAQLPLDVRGFTGRHREVAALDALLDRDCAVAVAVVMGTAGVGKTALALHWAHRVASRFPDGQLYIDLRGFDPDESPIPPDEAVLGFLDALGVPADRIPVGLAARAALYRSRLAGRRVLVVCDNAVSAADVRPLLPGSAGSLVVVTSRNRLTGLVVTEGAHPITLDPLTGAEARQLLVARLGAARVTADEPAAGRIAGRCAGLPLALAVVAARAAVQPALSLGELAAELTDDAGLSGLAGPDAGVDVRSVFSWSYRRLDPSQATLFRALGLHRGPDFGVLAAASLAGVTAAVAGELLTGLANAHLVTAVGPARYTRHDLLRVYAAELAADIDAAAARRSAVERLLDHYLHTADAAAGELYPHRFRPALAPPLADVVVEVIVGRDGALDWFGRERRNLVIAVDQAATVGLVDHAWQLAVTIGVFVGRRGHWPDWTGALRAALAAAERVGHRRGQAHAHSGLGLAACRLHRYDEAHRHLVRALGLFGELDECLGQAYTHLRWSAVWAGRGRPAVALAHSESARELFAAVGHAAGVAQALNNIGWYEAELGRHHEAIGHCELALALHAELGDRAGMAHTLDSLGFIHHRLGAFDRAARFYHDSAQMLRETGDRTNEAFALDHLGDARLAAGEPVGARDAWGAALRILNDLGHPDHDRVAVKLGG